MFLYQYALIAGFILLLFNDKTRLAAAIFVVSWAFYVLVVIESSATTYYAQAATIELLIGYALNKRFRLVSWLSYLLVALNLYGLLVHFEHVGRDIYVYACAIVSVVRFLLLLARAIPNGICRLHGKCFMVRCLNYDRGESYGKMYTNPSASKKNSCQAK